MVVLVPFLLITAVFSRLTIVELNLPSSTGGAPSSVVPFTIEVIVRESGIEITNGTDLIASIDDVEGEYDLQALSDHMIALKREYPDHETASVLLEPLIPYDYLIQVMDVVRSVELPTGNDSDFELYSLFGQISVGDAP
jgi:biopolymer transport protein ExbD